MTVGYVKRGAEEGNRGQPLVSVLGMLAEDGPLLVRQRSHFLENLVRDAHLADVVQKCAPAGVHHVGLAHLQFVRQLHGHLRHSLRCGPRFPCRGGRALWPSLRWPHQRRRSVPRAQRCTSSQRPALSRAMAASPATVSRNSRNSKSITRGPRWKTSITPLICPLARRGTA